MMYQRTFESPLGTMLLQASATGLSAASFILNASSTNDHSNAVLDNCCEQLAAYFAGTRTRFELPLAPEGTQFQQRIWSLLTDIPFGTTVSYTDLSRSYGDEKAIRAVAAANGQNPIAIFIPCHRVVGANGNLTGFAWGIERKQWLLNHEARLSGRHVQASLF